MSEHTTTPAGDDSAELTELSAELAEADQGGELLPFPTPAPPPAGAERDDQAADDLATGHPAENPADEDERVPVDPPEVPASALGPVWERQTDRRPILPAWVTDPDTRRAAARWAWEHSRHVTAYHSVQLPVYCGRLVARSPRGLGRTLVAVGRWAFDAESAGLRRDANWRGEPREFVKLMMRRDERVRGRLAALTFAALGLVLTAVTLRYAAPGWVQLAAVGSTVGLLGLAGRRQDRPVVGPAVVTAAPPRLTADIVVRALGSLGLAGINQAVTKGHGITFPARSLATGRAGGPRSTCRTG
jgi:S-DNA-T family DNA segregation ATPase FtsK/SpoIIIE